ncbi:vitamin K epoxide reductase complex subunit 1-like [Homalodisca vitripennis]|uniref:vitamin K epoxide reductase complex subunit 1-like n=1 Tax=Homalodisca vitripennis TaxID=197043 RepID=UPI001EEA78EF|nr:vitamin K epoxide reductase complex subunit 1-like [Homalodisca vitripennis]XP_046679830.1 vitamin K epoxide reductase complex subunit 1-like [Homalodisca vitripennis]XP_046679832.1 vitamin K epoxide reductase complex subunit 1-like [Homalodisca vitripennis]XP_046679833.1 vitamin K epoxide reductase complex subunit 1-like [Homalodisca vitripennis]XP_046679834.1 vitamin K epoxide reductase complex subunit 1-like [Homalodisca vitripennis]
MQTLKRINIGVRASSCVGFILSVYAYVVETSKEHDSTYSALCDINEHMSCSRVFTSKYGRGFGLLYHLVGQDSVLNQPNSVGGMVFYIMVILLSYSDKVAVTKLLICFSIVSNVCSVYLACILYFVLHDFCVVCVSTYVVNAVNLALTIAKLRTLRELSTKAKDD